MPTRDPLYVHTLTTQFANTLDEIPQDMSRHFADLRELDAVLSASLQQITQRINDITERIEETLAPGATPNPALLFQAITEIADETQRIKLGGEDKIRVASLAADNMNAYYLHLEELVRQMQPFDEALQLPYLAPKTTYPHVPPGTYNDIQIESRRTVTRRHAQANGLNPNGRSHVIESPVKRRRVIQREDTDESTPRRGTQTLDAESWKPGVSRPRGVQRRPRADITPQASPAVASQQLPPFRAHPPNSGLGVSSSSKLQASHSPLLPPLPAAPSTTRRAPPSAHSRQNELPMIPVNQDIPSYHDPNPRHGVPPHSDYMQHPPHHMMHSHSQHPAPAPPQHIQSVPPTSAPLPHQQSHHYHSSQYMPRSHQPVEPTSVPNAPPYDEPRHHHPSHHPPPVAAPPKYRSHQQPPYMHDQPNVGHNSGLSQPIGSLPQVPTSNPPSGPIHKEDEPALFRSRHRDHNDWDRLRDVDKPMMGVIDVRSGTGGLNTPNERPHGPPIPASHRSNQEGISSNRERLQPNQINGGDDTLDGDDNKAYCICHQPSFGEMIGCDASDCEFEWFHLGCLKLTEPPIGEWMCNACTQRHKRGRKGTRKKVAARRGGRV